MALVRWLPFLATLLLYTCFLVDRCHSRCLTVSVGAPITRLFKRRVRTTPSAAPNAHLRRSVSFIWDVPDKLHDLGMCRDQTLQLWDAKYSPGALLPSLASFLSTQSLSASTLTAFRQTASQEPWRYRQLSRHCRYSADYSLGTAALLASFLSSLGLPRLTPPSTEVSRENFHLAVCN
jgi:hypothetical protein